ncbi:nucleotidyltransferase domain-containing protein [Candidatus Woesearchaeota archaeon]|nr:nucleotidyltransferase domain-containing protein [Candidatus Woesearchaeota archaeon]
MMMKLSKNQQAILSLLRKDLFLKASIRQIMILLRKKSYARIYEAVLGLEKQGILKTERFGHSKVVELFLGRETISLLSFMEETEAFQKNIPGMGPILEAKELSDDIIIITGSYAKGRQTKGSDIDLAIMTRDDPFKKQKLVENLTLSSNPPVHPVVFSENNFKEMLLDKKENFGKETYKNRLILTNAKRFFEIINEANKSGFRG